MSFRFKNQTVTLENYRKIFKECPPDILDEIRSAVLDDTAISSFIKPCGVDSYKLGQLRMGVRELIPVEYLNPSLTGKTIYNIRQGFIKNRDMSILLKYFNSKGLKIDKEVIEKISDFCLLGVDVSKIDFKTVPNKLVDIVCKGLYQGYPMWLLLDESNILDEGMINVLMRGLSLGIDIHPFLSGEWEKSILLLIFSYAKSVDLNEILRYINSKFDQDSIKVLLDLASRNVPINTLCITDKQDFPVYNSYQMYELGLAIEDGVITNEMYRIDLSDYDIQTMRLKALANKDKK